MADLIVVGGGYWGTAIAWHARMAGAKVLVFDNHEAQGASRNSAGLFKMGWWKSTSAATRMVPAEWDWFHGPSVDWVPDSIISWTGESSASYRKPGHWRYGSDCAIVDPERLLGLSLALPDKVVGIDRVDAGWRVHTGRGPHEATNVVIAAGVWTDDLLTASGFEPLGLTGLRGRAAL